MKIKHLKTKTTIELTPEEVHYWITKVNQLDSMLDNVSEMKDLYLSDIQNLDELKWRMTRLFNLNWDTNTHRYSKGNK